MFKKTVLSLAEVTFFALAFVSLAFSQAFNADGLTIGLWHLDETTGNIAHDVSASAANGAVGGATWDSDGWFDGCLSFDGVNDSLRIDLATVEFIGNTFAVEQWVNVASLPSSEWSTIWSFYCAQQQMPLKLWPDGRISFRIIESGLDYDEIFSTTHLELGRWYHIACQYNDGMARLYIDCVEEASLAVSYRPEIPTYYVLDVGKMRRESISNPTHGNWFEGRVDELRISSSARACLTPALVAHWPMDEPAGTFVEDISGNDNHGTASGSLIVDGCDELARQFGTASDVVSVSDATSINFVGDFTISAKVILHGVTADGKILIKAESYTNFHHYQINIGGNNRTFGFQLGNPDVNKVFSNSPVPLNECVCLVAIREGNEMRIYIDGQLEGTATCTTEDQTNGGDLLIGKHPFRNDQNFPGIIDDVRMWNYALNDEEITEICASSLPVALDIKPKSCPNPLNVKPYVSFEDGSRGMATGGRPSYDREEHARNKKAVLPAAIPGSAEFEVTDINPETVMLNGVGLARHSYEDVTTPADKTADPCACNEDGDDGYEDMTLKFYRDDIVESLGEVADGDVISLTVTGELYDGTPFEGSDCIVIVYNDKDDDEGDEMMVVTNEPPSSSNYPNPFNPTTEISFSLPDAGPVTLEVFNIVGQRIEVLVDGQRDAGHHTVMWDANGYASGIYLYRLTADDFVETKRMVLVK